MEYVSKKSGHLLQIHVFYQNASCLIRNLFRLLIASINFFIGVCIPSLSDAFGCNLFEHIEDNLFIIILLHIFLF